MPSEDLNNKLREIVSFLSSEFRTIPSDLSNFGYRERIKIERCLFLLIKIICKNEFDYELQGFSKRHIENLSLIIPENLSSKSFVLIFEKAYQTKIYLKALSSGNGYVRGDTLSKLGLNRKTVFPFIQDHLDSIKNYIFYLISDC